MYFDGNSTGPRPDSESALQSFTKDLKSFGPNCISFSLYIGSSQELRTPEDHKFAFTRMDAIARILTKLGANSDRIHFNITDGKEHVSSVMSVFKGQANGRLRCDPTSKNPITPNGANCQTEYTRCYVELEDGTICNYDNVPNPNSAQYSVTP